MTQQKEVFEDGDEMDPHSPEEQIRALTRDSKDFLFMLAISGVIQSKTRLFQALAKTDLRNEANRGFTGTNATDATQKLKKAGLILSEAHGWSMRPDMENVAIGLLCNEEEYSSRAESIMTSVRSEMTRHRSRYHYHSEEDDIRLARIAYFLGDNEMLDAFVFPEENWKQSVALEFIVTRFDPKRFETLSANLREIVLYEGLKRCFNETLCPEKMLGKYFKGGSGYFFYQLVGEFSLIRGDFESVKKWTKLYQQWAAALPEGFEGWKVSAIADPISWEASMELLSGNVDEAISKFEECIKILKGKSKKKKFTPRGWSAFFYQLALMIRNSRNDLNKAVQLGEWALQLAETPRGTAPTLGTYMAKCLLGREKDVIGTIEYNNPIFLGYERSNISVFCFILAARLAGLKKTELTPWTKNLRKFSEDCEAEGFSWPAYEAMALAVALKGKPGKEDEKRIVKLKEALQFKPLKPLAELLSPPEPWELRITAIEAVALKHGSSAKKKSAKKKSAARKEVIWVLTQHEDHYYCAFDLYPMLRSVSAAGRPTKGRNIALKKIKESPDDVPDLTDHDRKVARWISGSSNWGGRFSYEFKDTRALAELAGHGLVFTEDGETGTLSPVKLSLGRFQIDASETKKGELKAVLKPALEPTDSYGMLVRDNPGEFTIYEISPEVKDFEEALGGSDTLTLPAKAKDRFLKAVSTLAEKIDIAADGELTSSSESDTGLIQVDGDSRPRLRLFPDGEGLMAQLVIQPIEKCDHRFAPGEGRDTIFGITDGKRTQAKRDLKAEAQKAQWLIDNSPSLAMKRGELRDLWSWQFDNPLSCLELLRDLAELPEENNDSIVEWPEDQPFKLHGIVSAGKFNGSLGSASEWLTISGDFQVNDEMVVSMRQLLDAASGEIHAGFLELGKGEFIALTGSFSRQLEDLRALAQPGKAEKIKLPPLAALALEDFVEEVGIKSKSKAWQEWIDRLKEAQNHFPDAPRNLQAELRPYQLEGYRWLSRLAKCGAGACLADDMGLGKTVQTLGLLLERAEGGPALVIAPTSVAANWFDECLKFAPTLNTIVFGNGDREKQLASAKPFDLVICTYGLLQREAEALAKIQWHTVVLDEAQAIKNSSTQRSKAARNLNADFRVVTTGTPVENRLSELHTLFQFILPGYLGGWEKFRKTFADPIEKYQDSAARDRLRRLLQPFMLRRLKSSVLRDLPSRTEVSIHVELSETESAFYEALRRKAVEEVEEKSEDKPGQKAFQILAQLTKLRRACCHPVLADKKNGAKLSSAKLEAFSETISDILAGNHKVLVFSQFVDHLTLIRKELDRKKVTYQYLDGSTSRPKRKAAVDAFQRGESDAFLISLKAGGFGLNLTAADYVIHMDPWWNPATEDQASDRAHRIGQTRPVTIYRFITKDTIEEKIVALHHKKRELAESLLSGTDVADSKLSPDDLMKLLKEQ